MISPSACHFRKLGSAKNQKNSPFLLRSDWGHRIRFGEEYFISSGFKKVHYRILRTSRWIL
ncbi:hypothetical protein CH367_17360 [Leptospira barantonii]|uniref:Uncharacterized protein n=1 Tax=Leptospira barantonii TaxID=2023184 RepID=A0ABX4NGZ6_9LEPT|nr:hypothetical protein CH367_17360 [Leptospira barantonii]